MSHLAEGKRFRAGLSSAGPGKQAGSSLVVFLFLTIYQRSKAYFVFSVATLAPWIDRIKVTATWDLQERACCRAGRSQQGLSSARQEGCPLHHGSGQTRAPPCCCGADDLQLRRRNQMVLQKQLPH